MKAKVASVFALGVFIISVLTLLYFNSPWNDGLASKNKKDCFIIRVEGYFDGVAFQRNGPYWLQIEKGLIDRIYKKVLPESGRQNCHLQHQAGLFATPGLIDSHSHVFAFDKKIVHSWQEALTLSALSESYRRINSAKVNLLSLMQHGFTTVRDLGNSGRFLEKDFLTENSDLVTHLPRLVYSGPGLALSPSQINIRNNTEYLIIDSTTEFGAVVADYKNKGATWLKIYIDNSSVDSFVSLDLLRKIVSAAHEHNFKVAAHAEFKNSSDLANSAGVDSIEHFYQTTSHEIEFANTFVVPTEISSTVCSSLENKKFRMPECAVQKKLQQDRQKWLSQRKTRWVFGSDSVLDFTTNYRSRGESTLHSLIQLTELGWSPDEVLQSATSRAAEMLGLPIGAVKTGFAADIVLYSNEKFERSLNQNNLEFLLQPIEIYRNGRSVKTDNSNSLFRLIATQAGRQ